MGRYRSTAQTPGLALGLAVFLFLFLFLFLSLAASAGADPKVWVNTRAGTYHCPGSPDYGAIKPGKFLGERDAKGQGFRAADGQACVPQVAVKPAEAASARGTGAQRTRR